MAPLTEPAFARLRSVDQVLAEAAGDAAFELETDLFAALAKGIMEKGASDAFPFAWASLAVQIGEVSPERVLEAGSALEAFGKKTANALRERSAWSALPPCPTTRRWVPCVRCGAWMCALPCAY